jgi:hypothetical protein
MYYNEKDMEGKLVKLGEDDYILHVNNKPFAYKNLSLKNCQAIENGYDLMKLAEENSHKYYDVKTTDWHCNYNGFFSGFQKALEILGDKKFTKEDMGRIMVYGYDKSTENEYLSRIPFDEYIQSLQQTEWDVIIEMEPYHDGDFINDGKTHIIEAKLRYRLDSDGCLILKRK